MQTLKRRFTQGGCRRALDDTAGWSEVRRRLRRFVWPRPWLYRPWGAWRGNGDVLSLDYDLLIEGFPRTANSFAVAAFLAAQDAPVCVRSHRHTPAYAVRAIEAGKPVLALIREPAATAVSWSIHSGWSLAQSLESYTDYYTCLLRYRRDLCLADFAEVISSFSSVVERCNRMYGTSFNAGEDSEERTAAALDGTEATKGMADIATPELALRRASRPHPGRMPTQKELLTAIRSSRYRARMHDAMAVYSEMLGDALIDRPSEASFRPLARYGLS